MVMLENVCILEWPLWNLKEKHCGIMRKLWNEQFELQKVTFLNDHSKM